VAEAASDNRTSKSGRRETPVKSAIGTEFIVVDEVAARSFRSVVLWMASVTAAVVLSTACYGLVSGSYNAIITVWSVAGPILGVAAAYLFVPSGLLEQHRWGVPVNRHVRSHSDDAAAMLDIERILARLDTGIPEPQHAMDALLARLRTTRVAA
jgi:hypothetical protein